MRGNKCKEWEEGESERGERREEKVVERNEEGGKEKKEKRALRTERARGLFIGHTSERKRAGE